MLELQANFRNFLKSVTVSTPDAILDLLNGGEATGGTSTLEWKEIKGEFFDSKMNRNAHIASAITKAKKALYALRQLKKYFNNLEMRTLLDSNFYSILYYNAVIWLTPNISCDLKQDLLSVSANALNNCLVHSGFNRLKDCIKFIPNAPLNKSCFTK